MEGRRKQEFANNYIDNYDNWETIINNDNENNINQTVLDYSL